MYDRSGDGTGSSEVKIRTTMSNIRNFILLMITKRSVSCA